jgi:hypothetical protein
MSLPAVAISDEQNSHRTVQQHNDQERDQARFDPRIVFSYVAGVVSNSHFRTMPC